MFTALKRERLTFIIIWFEVLGKGSFGKVMLVKKVGDISGTLYAMKTLRKAALIKRNQLAHTSTERTILQNINCPFLVHLVYAFQTQDKLYMVLDYMGGGELFFWLKKDRKFSEDRVRLYTAEISLALEALHNADIVYRDLKPENILWVPVGIIEPSTVDNVCCLHLNQMVI
jgi:serum/glucocorticoid-regulated kinase 2